MSKTNLVLTLFLLYSPTNYADQWRVDAKIKQDFAYDDNVRMSQDNPQGSLEYKFTPVANFSLKTDNFFVHASTSYGLQRYPQISSLNRTTQAHTIGMNYLTERSEWTVNATMNVAPSRNTAVEDSGVFSSDSQKTTLMVNPFFSYKLTELDVLKLTANYTQTTYSTTDFSNYQSHLINFAWQRQWTERYSSSISASYSTFQSSSVRLNTKLNSGTYNLNFGSTYAISEQWDITGTIGGRFTKSENTSTFGSTKSQSQGFLLNAGLNYKGEQLSGQLNLSRSLMPSSRGQLQEQNRVGLNLQYQITERLSSSLTTNYQVTSRSATDNERASRENIILQPAINWHVSQDWTVTGSYRYRGQNIAGTQNKQAESNLFMLSINYNWQGLSLSR